ncbi:MAG: hypothetical protein LQ337_007197 [Flavoplaca oasis]|nr:MAG: hypothetical protein LQ337_007197 [Flavoplaca oasis]
MSATTPNKYSTHRATLAYLPKGQVAMAPDNWRVLDVESGVYGKGNVGPLEIAYRVSITQRSKALKGTSCTLEFQPDAYNNPMVSQEGTAASSPIKVQSITVSVARALIIGLEIVMTCQGPAEENQVGRKPTLHLTRDEKEAAKLPLAQQWPSFDQIRLEIQPADLKSTGGGKAVNPGDKIAHLRVLLTGRFTLDPENIYGKKIRDDKKGIQLEREAQASQFTALKGCRIVTKRGRGNNVLVEVHLANPGDEARQGQKIGLCYSLIAPKTFPVDEGTLRSHRIRNAPETTGWQITLQKSTDPASQSNVYTGTISNTIKASEISTFADKEESDVELEPIILSALEGFFVSENEKKAKRAKIPASMLFGGLPYDAERNKIENLDSKTLASMADYVADKLNPNVAVDNLLDAAVARWEALAPSGRPAPFVRVLTENQIESLWQMGDFEKLNRPYNLDQVRYRFAMTQGNKWAAYLAGRAAFEKHAVIDDDKLYAAYAKQVKLLNRLVLD